MDILVVNAGSSSLKLSLLTDDRLVDATSLSAPGGRLDEGQLADFVERHGRPDAVGHRIVHGGTRYREAVVVDDEVVRQLDALTDLAPLHQPKSLHALRVVRELMPDVPSVACFDTAFHAHLPEAAATYPLPEEWRSRFALRRYGFHGLSHAWATRRAAALNPGARRVVSCHLGAGASLAAVLDNVCVDTTMGFTPLDGLVMATRSGSLDPGLVLWLIEHARLSAGALADILENRSGLTALAGTGDMRELLARVDERAQLAVEVYLHRLRAEISAMTAALGGLDTLVFTGGVGENAAGIRARAADGLSYLGVAVDATRNDEVAGNDADITAAGATVTTLVVVSREDQEIALAVRRLLAG